MRKTGCFLAVTIFALLIGSAFFAYQAVETSTAPSTASSAVPSTDTASASPSSTDTSTTVVPNDDAQTSPQVVDKEEEIVLSLAEQTLAQMTTAEKIGQLLMMDFRTNADGTGMTTLGESVATQIADYALGGVILFAENLDTATQTTQLIADMQACASIPLFIGVDEEGGLVSRLGNSNIAHTDFAPMGTLTSTEQAAEAGQTIGSELVALGFNVNFAPVADVNTNPANTVIGNRAFSSDATIAAERVAAFVTALQQEGISGSAKHFPGHGDTATDSHYGIATVSHDLERLLSVELLPFQAAAQAGVDMMMLGHISTPNVTGNDLPASLSADMVALLRESCDFDGVITTDAMNMQAITDYFGVGEAAVLAVQAGVDLVLMPADLTAAYTALEQAVAEGEITMDELDAHVLTVLRLKEEKGMLGEGGS